MSLGTLQYWRATERGGELVAGRNRRSACVDARSRDRVIECGRLRVHGLELDAVAELLRRLA